MVGIKNILDIYDKLDIAKVIFRVYHLLKDHEVYINNKDETLFQKDFVILPEINLSSSWDKLVKGQKEKLWTYMKILLIESEILVNCKKDDPETVSNQTDTQAITTTTQQSSDFNPYMGIAPSASDGKYGVDEMFSVVPTFEDDKPDGGGIDTIASMVGLDKMINLDDLTNQLKNMKKEDIENATNNIKGLLGSTIDDKTTSLITDMLSNISEELQKGDLSNGNPIKNILNVAESVACKMKPKINPNDLSQLLNSTQTFANQCKDKKGNPIFSDKKMNPFSLLGQFANNMGQGNMSEEQCAQQCNDLLKKMGMKNINLDNFNLNDLSKQMNKTGKKKKK
jgi:hypothetical protein